MASIRVIRFRPACYPGLSREREGLCRASIDYYDIVQHKNTQLFSTHTLQLSSTFEIRPVEAQGVVAPSASPRSLPALEICPRADSILTGELGS